MKQIEVYDLDFENITDICEDNNVDEWEVIEAMLDAIRDKKIDITKWLQEGAIMEYETNWNEEELEELEELNDIFNLQEERNNEKTSCMDTREDKRRG